MTMRKIPRLTMTSLKKGLRVSFMKETHALEIFASTSLTNGLLNVFLSGKILKRVYEEKINRTGLM